MGGGNWLVLLLVAAGAVRLSGVGASEAGEKAMGQRRNFNNRPCTTTRGEGRGPRFVPGRINDVRERARARAQREQGFWFGFRPVGKGGCSRLPKAVGFWNIRGVAFCCLGQMVQFGAAPRVFEGAFV